MRFNKAIFVCDYSADYAGNFLASFAELAENLQKSKIKVYFIFPKKAQNKNWEINLSNFRVIYSEFDDKSLIGVINDNINDFDRAIVHLNFLSSLLTVKLNESIKNKNIIYVFQQHMDVNYGIKQVIKGTILRLFSSKTYYIGVSPKVYSDMCKEVGKDKCKLVINAIDLDRLDNLKYNNNNNILIFGTDFKRKGVDLAIKAINESEIKEKVRLIIVTHNPAETKAKIKQTYSSIPNFILVKRPTKDIKKLYANSFLFLSPSRLEAFGYAVVESAYAGINVIASDIPGQNVLKNIPSIRWMESENVEQLTGLIENIYKAKNEDRSNAINKTRQIIKDNYSLSAWVQKMMGFYNLISSRN